MLGLILAVAQASALAADAPMNSTREVGSVFATLQIDASFEDGHLLPLLGARLTAVFQRRFGLEASVAKAFLATLSELSALAVVKPKGIPVLLRAGVSHVPGYPGNGDIGRWDAATGFHAGAALLSGDAHDRARFRLDYTYRQLGHRERGVSSVGLGLVLNLD